MSIVTSLARRLWVEFISAPTVIVAVIVAALNTAEDQTWQGYALAVGLALLRQVLSPVYDFRPKEQ